MTIDYRALLAKWLLHQGTPTFSLPFGPFDSRDIKALNDLSNEVWAETRPGEESE